MYVLQFCNTFTKEVLRHFVYENPDEIHQMIRNFNNPAFFGFHLADYEFRIFEADFVRYRVYKNGNNTIYKFYFEMKLSDKQPLLRR